MLICPLKIKIMASAANYTQELFKKFQQRAKCAYTLVDLLRG